jgi:hypothetical protein
MRRRTCNPAFGIFSLLCLLLSGCVNNIKQGVLVPLTPDNRSAIKHIGIVVKDSPFKVKYASDKDMGTSAMIGGLILVGIEGSVRKTEDEKTAQMLYENISSSFDIKERAAKAIQSEFKAHGYEQISILSSEQQAVPQNIDTLLVCEISGWGVSIYPQVEPDKSVSTYADMTLKLSRLPEMKRVWEYSGIYLNRDRRTLIDFQKPDILTKDMDILLTSLSKKVISRLMNS